MFDYSEYSVREAEKARRRRRYNERTGSVHKRRNLKNRRADAADNHSRQGKREISRELAV